jgi:DNA-binding transcriptional MocR family regulator
MSLERRKDILEMARTLNLLIIEDDPYSIMQLPPYIPPSNRKPEPVSAGVGVGAGAGEDVESMLVRVGERYGEGFMGTKKLLPSLASLDEDGRVIFLYTFSKILGPSFRVGFTSMLFFIFDLACFTNCCCF